MANQAVARVKYACARGLSTLVARFGPDASRTYRFDILWVEVYSIPAELLLSSLGQTLNADFNHTLKFRRVHVSCGGDPWQGYKTDRTIPVMAAYRRRCLEGDDLAFQD